MRARFRVGHHATTGRPLWDRGSGCGACWLSAPPASPSAGAALAPLVLSLCRLLLVPAPDMELRIRLRAWLLPDLRGRGWHGGRECVSRQPLRSLRHASYLAGSAPRSQPLVHAACIHACMRDMHARYACIQHAVQGMSTSACSLRTADERMQQAATPPSLTLAALPAASGA